jgi:hypothetical protein
MKKNTNNFLFLALFLIFFTNFSHQLHAQGNNMPVIYVSGMVVTGEQAEPLPGVHIYIPKAGRGTASNSDGMFTMPVIAGDSLIISCVGYKKRFYRVPKDKIQNYSVVIELKDESTMLPIVEIFPYPTEELWKEAILAMELPDKERMERLQENISPEAMERLAMSMPMDARMNAKYTFQDDAVRLGNQTFMPTVSLLNPFAWAQFFKSVKRGDFKRGRWKERR